MLSVIKSKRFLMALLMGVFGFGVGLIYDIAPLFELTLEQLDFVWQDKSAELLPLLAVSGSICCIVSFFAYYIGDYLRERLKLTADKMNKKSLIILLLSSVLIPILIGIIDISTNNPEAFSFVSVYYVLINTSAGMLYNGVIEEIWFRLCFMPLMIFVFYKVFSKYDNKKSEGIDKKYIIAGIVFSALFMFVIQMNTIFTTYVPSFIIFLRLILVYLLPNLVYGGLYIKHGIKWSIIAHIIFMFIHLGVMPFVVTLI